MANPDLAWLKWFPARAQNSLRWQSLTLEERGLFHELYDLAALASPRGALVAPDGCDLDALLAARLRVEVADFRRILGALVARRLIVRNEAQALIFPDFATHQRNTPARVRRKDGAGVARKRRKSGAGEGEGEGEREREGKKKKDKGRRKKTPAASRHGFDEFYAAYPKKKQPKDALKAWKQATDKPALAVLLAALEEQKKSKEWTKDDGQFIPYPASWLRAGSWDDDAGAPNTTRNPPDAKTDATVRRIAAGVLKGETQ